MSTRSIYIVDDDPAVRTALHSLLSTRSDLLVFSYRSGSDFVEQIAQLDPGCVLLDYDMPGLNGIDVLHEVATQPRRFGVIVLTGQGATDIAVKAWKFGALDFLEKPCEPATLMSVIETAFATIERDHAAVARARQAKAAIANLSAREHDVLMGLIEGRTNKRIAHDLDISPRTIEIYRANVMTKLNVRSLSEALRIAFAAGLISPS